MCFPRGLLICPSESRRMRYILLKLVRAWMYNQHRNVFTDTQSTASLDIERSMTSSSPSPLPRWPEMPHVTQLSSHKAWSFSVIVKVPSPSRIGLAPFAVAGTYVEPLAVPKPLVCCSIWGLQPGGRARTPISVHLLFFSLPKPSRLRETTAKASVEPIAEAIKCPMEPRHYCAGRRRSTPIYKRGESRTASDDLL